MDLLMSTLPMPMPNYPLFGGGSISTNDDYIDENYIDFLPTEEIIIPLMPPQNNFALNQPYPMSKKNVNHHRFSKYVNNFIDINPYFAHMNKMNKNPQGYQVIEEEYINMNQQRASAPKKNGSALDSLINSFNHAMKPNREITEEHIDLTGGSINDIHLIGDGYTQRRPSFKRHVTVPYGLSSQADSGNQGLQRSASAQNIHVDARLAESERNINYCVRFAVNGLSKSHMGNIPPINKNIQAGDFGDDSGMIAENSKCIVLGLADGAGGNREIGIDPKKFSRCLLGFCVETIKNEEVLPHQVSRLATRAIQQLESRNIIGSGTLCLLSLNKDTNIMTTLNMGDSGYRLVRNGKIHQKSRATMAGSSPRQVFVTESRFSGISFIDEKDIGRDSDLREFRVKKGDIIVMSSDGLFDVINDHEIERVVNAHNPRDLQGIADELVQIAMRSYLQTHRDDILVMVCRIELKKNFM